MATATALTATEHDFSHYVQTRRPWFVLYGLRLRLAGAQRQQVHHCLDLQLPKVLGVCEANSESTQLVCCEPVLRHHPGLSASAITSIRALIHVTSGSSRFLVPPVKVSFAPPRIP